MSVTICETVTNSHECSNRDAPYIFAILGVTAYYYTYVLGSVQDIIIHWL